MAREDLERYPFLAHGTGKGRHWAMPKPGSQEGGPPQASADGFYPRASVLGELSVPVNGGCLPNSSS